MNEEVIAHGRAFGAALELSHRLRPHGSDKSKAISIYGIPRGGVSAAYLLALAFRSRGFAVDLVSSAASAQIITDDIWDTGATMRRVMGEASSIRKDLQPVVLFARSKEATPSWVQVGEFIESSNWLVFPWENSIEASAEDIPIRLLRFIGENPERPGLAETPARFIKAWQHWSGGYQEKPEDILKVFEDGAEKYDQLLIQRDIPIYSHCEHHLAPFFGVAHIGYMPDKKIVGLSKLSRIVDIFSRRLQVQERLTEQIAHALWEHLQPRGVIVVLQCRHLCMESRGIERAGTSTITSSIEGMLRELPALRAEFFSLLKNGAQ